MSNPWHFRQIPQKDDWIMNTTTIKYELPGHESFKFPMRHIFMHWLAKRASFQSLEAECRLNCPLIFQISFPRPRLHSQFSWRSPKLACLYKSYSFIDQSSSSTSVASASQPAAGENFLVFTCEKALEAIWQWRSFLEVIFTMFQFWGSKDIFLIFHKQ